MATGNGVGRGGERAVALRVAVSTLGLAVLVLPWAGHRVAAVPGSTTIWLTLLLLIDLLTPVLLLGHHRAGASRRLVVLSWAYVWSASVAVQLAWTTPGVLRADPRTPEAAQTWLWLSLHVAPVVLVAAALVPWPRRWEQGPAAQAAQAAAPTPVRSTSACAGWLLVALLAAVPTVVISRVAAPSAGSLASAEAEVSGPLGTTAVVVTALALVAALVAVRRRHAGGIQSWATVTAAALVADGLLDLMGQGADTVGAHLAQVLTVGAGVVVSAAVVAEGLRERARTLAESVRLEDRNLALVEAQRLREHMSAVVSHDMRTPLAGLQGYLELLLEDDDLAPPLVRRMHERSWTLTRRLSLLTEDLLAAATLEHRDLAVVREALDVAGQLAECGLVFPDLDLHLDCEPGLLVRADPLRLQQILANLVRNAQKHGAEPVTITARQDPAGVRITVSDAGPGVPADFVDRLFDRYTQASSTGGGSGLGLSVVRDLVEAHDGTVAYDEAKHGFVIVLPGPTAASGAVTAPVGRVGQTAGQPSTQTPTPTAGQPSTRPPVEPAAPPRIAPELRPDPGLRPA